MNYLAFALPEIAATTLVSLSVFAVSFLVKLTADILERRKAAERAHQLEEIKHSWEQGLKPGEKAEYQLLISTSPASNVASQTTALGNDAIADLRDQLASLSERVRSQRKEIVQKIDPVLEATLKISIDNLTQRIEALEKRQLEKWDCRFDRAGVTRRFWCPSRDSQIFPWKIVPDPGGDRGFVQVGN